MKPYHAIFNRIKASPRCYPHTHFTRVESDNTPDTKELRSLLTLAVSYGAVGTGAAHQYAEPQHQNKLCLPKCSTPLCGLLLLYLSQPNTIHWSKLIASVGKVKEDGTRLKDYRRFAIEEKKPLAISPNTSVHPLLISHPTCEGKNPVVFKNWQKLPGPRRLVKPTVYKEWRWGSHTLSP